MSAASPLCKEWFTVCDMHIAHTQHLCNLKITSGSSVAEEKSKKPKEYKFHIHTPDGRCILKVSPAILPIVFVIDSRRLGQVWVKGQLLLPYKLLNSSPTLCYLIITGHQLSVATIYTVKTNDHMQVNKFCYSQCHSAEEKNEWVMHIQKIITVRLLNNRL